METLTYNRGDYRKDIMNEILKNPEALTANPKAFEKQLDGILEKMEKRVALITFETNLNVMQVDSAIQPRI